MWRRIPGHRCSLVAGIGAFRQASAALHAPIPLSATEIEQALKQQVLVEWKWVDDSLHREFVFRDFKEAMAFMNQVGVHAEEQQHHPAWQNVYNRVTVALHTHDADNRVTMKDLTLAKSMSTVFEAIHRN